LFIALFLLFKVDYITIAAIVRTTVASTIAARV